MYDTRKAQTRFGLLCRKLLAEFIANADGRQPFDCIWHLQETLASAADQDIPKVVIDVNPTREKSYIVRVSEFSCSQPMRVHLRMLNGRRYRHDAWQSNELAGMINPQTKMAIVGCLKEWIDLDALPEKKVLVLASHAIRERYDVTEKQIRDWAKKESKPFITKIEGARKYLLLVDDPELASLKKK